MKDECTLGLSKTEYELDEFICIGPKCYLARTVPDKEGKHKLIYRMKGIR